MNPAPTQSLLVAALLLILTPAVSAAKVAVVIDYPDAPTYTRCLVVSEGTNGYELLNELGLDMVWSPASQWGHGLCDIEGTSGCTQDDCFCGGSEYWGIYLAQKGDRGWGYLPVGFDGGSQCWNHEPSSFTGHYCAENGDTLGLRWGSYGQEPDFIRYEDICGTGRHRDRDHDVLEVAVTPVAPVAGELITFATGEKKAEVNVYTPDRRKVEEAVAADDGNAKLALPAGDYKVLVLASGYPHTYLDLTVAQTKTSTTAPTTSTTTTTLVFEESTAPPETEAEPTTSIEPTTSTAPATSTVPATTSLQQQNAVLKSVAKELTGRAVVTPKENAATSGDRSTGVLSLALGAFLIGGLYLVSRPKK